MSREPAPNISRKAKERLAAISRACGIDAEVPNKKGREHPHLDFRGLENLGVFSRVMVQHDRMRVGDKMSEVSLYADLLGKKPALGVVLHRRAPEDVFLAVTKAEDFFKLCALAEWALAVQKAQADDD